MLVNKSKKRTAILNTLMEALKSPDVFDIINYKRSSEDKIKHCMHMPLANAIKKLYEDRGLRNGTVVKKVKESLIWESNRNQTLSNIKLFGVQHRTDFLVIIDGVKIAIEIKKGDTGSSIRGGIGQSIFYSNHYDFVIYLYIDTTKDDRIKKSMKDPKENAIIKELWKNNNVMFDVI